MIPIPQVLSQRFIASETESLRAVTSILPVEGTQAEAPLWERMRPGMQFTGLIVQKDAGQKEPANPGNADLAAFKVQIQLPNQPPMMVQMQLPAYLSQQQTLNMQFMGLAKAQGKEGEGYPQVRWGVQSSGLDTAKLASTGLLADMPHTEEHALNQSLVQNASGQATLVELSLPAKHLQRWLDSTPFQSQYAVLQSQSVVSQSPQKPQVLAQDLKHALDSSGLFYESHLKEATLGTRPWHQLLQEPQNKPNFIPPEMVSQQLQVLEQQRVIWQGEVWPGQAMEWQVSERQNSEQSSEDPTLNSLFSNLKLQLPRLGEVAVRITLSNGRFSVRVQPTDSASLKEMQSGRSALAMNLQASGVKLDSLQIVREEIVSRDKQYAAG